MTKAVDNGVQELRQLGPAYSRRARRWRGHKALAIDASVVPPVEMLKDGSTKATTPRGQEAIQIRAAAASLT